MSADNPVIHQDRRVWSHKDGGDDDTMSVEPDDDAGAWPEEMDDIRFYADTAMTIPGQSDPPGDCGKNGPKEFCKACGEIVFGKQRCQRRLCEDCWETWRGQQAAAVTRRLAGARRAADGREKRATHSVVSPPEGSVKSLNDVYKGKQEAYDLAKQKGIRGGVLIFHGYRITEEAKEVFRAKKDVGEIADGVGIWQWVREHERDWRTLTYWSPHYHIIGVGYDIGQSDPEGDDGWVFSRLSNLRRFDHNNPKSYESMFRVASYLLSHGTFETDAGKQLTRWFGELANNQFSLESELEEWEVSVIDRMVQKVAGYSLDEEDGERECDVEGCTGGLAPIWSAYDYLSDQRWCERLDDDQEAKLAAAFEWAIGDLVPPPGLRYPQTEKELKEAWGSVLNQTGIDP